LEIQTRKINLNDVYIIDEETILKIKFLYNKLNLLKILITIKDIDEKIIDDYIRCRIDYDEAFHELNKRFNINPDQDGIIDFDKKTYSIKR